jgi:O-acetyl-ADP-ribose deacetylase (regulator of RNase III)
MITKHGNILSVKEGIIAHQCNAQGVMGSGIAKQIKALYPDAYTHYVSAIRTGELTLGMCQLVQVSRTLYIANLIGQDRYGRDGTQYTDYSALSQALFELSKLSKGLEVHHPLIGCGLGGGDWNTVKSLIERNLGNDTTLWLYE